MQILPRPQSRGQQLFEGFQSASEQIPTLADRLGVNYGKNRQEQKENERLKELTGDDFSGLSPDIKKEFVKNFTSSKGVKQQEKQKAITTALGTVKEMRALISNAGPSNLLKSIFAIGDSREKRAQLESLGRSLIPMVSAGVPIRNQKEFDEYRKIITDPNSRQDSFKGALNAIESILTRSLDDTNQINQQEIIPQKLTTSSSDMVKMRGPDGSEQSVPKSRVKDAMKAGAVVIK